MSIEWIIVGLITLVVGIAFCFAGFKYFLLLLPIWGAVVGFSVGMDAIHLLLGNGFFSSALAIVVGIALAIAFAALSYLYYSFAVILLGASIGYMVGISVMDALNIGGAVAWIVGAIVGGIFAYGFMFLAMPVVLAIWGTAVGGAASIVTGVILILNLGRFPGGVDNDLASLSAGSLVQATELPWLWLVIGIALAVAGAFAQIRMIGTAAESITKAQYKNPGMA